ncbi:hypothetical protein C1H76_6814 [Elsinoe australis]|uniref:Uncharacterized protein n=1 Tax=Elsinoe australis TaxID=40998 RepID=A0A4U7ARS0_9PEZI|nr:hypothetical protein C1H76_6814 [Elsinoe australis]
MAMSGRSNATKPRRNGGPSTVLTDDYEEETVSRQQSGDMVQAVPKSAHPFLPAPSKPTKVQASPMEHGNATIISVQPGKQGPANHQQTDVGREKALSGASTPTPQSSVERVQSPAAVGQLGRPTAPMITLRNVAGVGNHQVSQIKPQAAQQGRPGLTNTTHQNHAGGQHRPPTPSMMQAARAGPSGMQAFATQSHPGAEKGTTTPVTLSLELHMFGAKRKTPPTAAEQPRRKTVETGQDDLTARLKELEEENLTLRAEIEDMTASYKTQKKDSDADHQEAVANLWVKCGDKLSTIDQEHKLEISKKDLNHKREMLQKDQEIQLLKEAAEAHMALSISNLKKELERERKARQIEIIGMKRDYDRMVDCCASFGKRFEKSEAATFAGSEGCMGGQ